MLENETEYARWRVHWVSALALVRAVGHVLKKIDGKDARYRVCIDAAFVEWKSNRSKYAIFWEFIEEERNSILKEYQFNVHPLEEVDVLVSSTLRNTVTGEDVQVGEMVRLRENIYRPIMDGFGEGIDARDMYREALDWWDTELSAIEKDCSRSVS
ncbi:MAG: hypothetical protein OXJ64_05930 [Boseongicola sp.]|nr:hypothetical protein [Boseongicola sp.]